MPPRRKKVAGSSEKRNVRQLIAKLKKLKNPTWKSCFGGSKEIGYLIYDTKHEEYFYNKTRQFFMEKIGISQLTLEYIESIPKYERELLNRQAMIHFHQSEIDRLSKEMGLDT